VQVNLHDAKTHLSRYVDQALAGEEVVIARAGKPLVRLMPVGSEPQPRRLGFLAGTARVEADLKRDFATEINTMFQLDVEAPPQETWRAFCWTPSS
jgi:prevent-host-death family protein